MFNFARRLKLGLLLSVPHAYGFLTPQWRHRLLYLRKRPHDPDFLALSALDLGENPIVLDVGGNLGQSVYSIFALIPGAQIRTFEPNPIVARKLCRLLGRFPNLTVENVGLSDESGQQPLYVPEYNHNSLTELASFDYQAAAGWLSPKRMLWFSSKRLTILSEVAILRKLDDYQLDPAFIKVDVQGLEDRVINGGLDTIKRSRPVIMAESVSLHSDSTKTLFDLGYSLMEWHTDGFRLATADRQRVNQFFLPQHPRAR